MMASSKSGLVLPAANLKTLQSFNRKNSDSSYNQSQTLN